MSALDIAEALLDAIEAATEPSRAGGVREVAINTIARCIQDISSLSTPKTLPTNAQGMPPRVAVEVAIPVTAALGIINSHLGIQMAVTAKNDEAKCCVPDLEGGASRAYFNAKDLYELAECFEAVATSIQSGTAND